MRADQISRILDRAFRLPDHVVYRSFALETVVVNLERGVYHGLNPTAGRMLESLEQAPSARSQRDRSPTNWVSPLRE